MVVANAILTFEEADLGVEMRPDFSVVADQLQPIALIMEHAAEVCLA